MIDIEVTLKGADDVAVLGRQRFAAMPDVGSRIRLYDNNTELRVVTVVSTGHWPIRCDGIGPGGDPIATIVVEDVPDF